jgi:hypothetical protein
MLLLFDDSYGFVTATPVRVTNTDGDKVWQYEIWNGSKTITVFEDKTSQSADKGEFIQYNVVSDTEIEDIQNNIGSYDAVTAIRLTPPATPLLALMTRIRRLSTLTPRTPRVLKAARSLWQTSRSTATIPRTFMLLML